MNNSYQKETQKTKAMDAIKTTKEKAAEIKAYYAGIPEKQVSAGVYLKSVGTKYVTLINTWGATTIKKVPIDDFYNDRF